MSRELIESIVSNNMLEANDMVEAKLAEIRERKLHEMKRMFAAKMEEGVGGLTLAQVQARKELGWKRASEVLPDPREARSGTTTFHSKPKKVKKKLKEDIDPEQVKAEKERLKKAGKAYPQYGSGTSDEGPSTPRDASSMGRKKPEDKSWSDLASKLDRKQKQGPRRDAFLKSRKYTGWKFRQNVANAKRKVADAASYVKKDILSGGPIKRAAKSPVMQDLKDIGFRNL